jgi:lipopolysaccharide transport system ATP-binding protein
MTAAGKPAARFASDESFLIEIECWFAKQTEAQVAFRLNSDRDCETILTTALSDRDGDRHTLFRAGKYVTRCHIPAHLLVPGSYHLLVALNNPYGQAHDLVERALSFEITEIGSLKRFDNRQGVIAPLLSWDCNPDPTTITS